MSCGLLRELGESAGELVQVLARGPEPGVGRRSAGARGLALGAFEPPAEGLHRVAQPRVERPFELEPLRCRHSARSERRRPQCLSTASGMRSSMSRRAS